MKINDINIVEPLQFNITDEILSVKNRTASGKLVEDIISIKKIFTLTYRGLKRSDLQQFLDVQGEDFTFEYTDNDITYTNTVKIGSIGRTINTEVNSVSTGIIITLEEV